MTDPHHAPLRGTCPVCQRVSTDAIFAGHEVIVDAFRGAEPHYFLCQGCALAFQDPPFRVDQLSDELRQAEVAGQTPFGTTGLMARVYALYYGFTRSVVLRGRQRGRPRLLDVGCGTGQFCRAASRRFEVWGVEPAPEACRVAREQHGLHNIVCSDFRPELFDVRFDVITLWQTFEHLDGPLLQVLETAHELLVPGGLLYLGEVPNLEGLEFTRFGDRCFYLASPVHNFLFTERFFHWALPRTGFERVQIRHDWKNYTLLSQSALLALQGALGQRLPTAVRMGLSALAYPLVLPASAVVAAARRSATFSVAARRAQSSGGSRQ